MRILDFSDSFESATEPLQGNIEANSVKTFASDADFVTDKGSAATQGDIYSRTSDDVIRYYDGTSWVSLASTTAVDSAITVHTSDTTDVHDASAISFNPAGSLSSTNVQAALEESASEAISALSSHESDTTSIHGITDTADLLTTSNTKAVTNKDIDGGTASNTSRITIPKNTKSNLDSLTRKEATLVYANDTDKLYYDDGSTLKLVGSGSGSGVNFITDGDAEGTQILTVYNDSSTTRPVNGDGGTQANLAVSISSTSPLAGTNSFLFTKSGYASTQGSGASIPFTIDLAHKAKVLQIEFDYIVNSGTFVAGSSTTDSDVIAYIYDVTNNTLIEPSSFKFLSNSSTISDKFIANFQTSATGTSYRLILHCATTSASNYELKLDNFQVSPCNYVYGTPKTNSTAYTPTLLNTTNVNFNTAYWAQDGDKIEIDGRITWNGAGAGGQWTVQLPPGLTFDSLKNTLIADDTLLGNFHFRNSGVEWRHGSVVYSSSNTVKFILDSSGNNLLGTDFNANDTLNYTIKACITGWSSSSQVSDGYDGRLITAQVFRETTGQALSGSSDIKIQWNGKTKDTTSSFDNVTNYRFVAPSQGTYVHTGQISLGTSSAASSIGVHLYKNGGPFKTIGYAAASTTVNCTIPISIESDANANDYFELYINPNGATITILSSASIYSGAQWNISKKQSPTTISATEVVAATYQTDAGQSLTTAGILKFEDKIFDTHNAYNTTTGIYTAPVQGLYSVSFSTFTIDTTTGQDFEIAIRKNSGNVARFHSGHYLTNRYSVNGTFIVSLLAGETIDIYNTSSFAAGTLYSSGQDNFFSIQRIK